MGEKLMFSQTGWVHPTKEIQKAHKLIRPLQKIFKPRKHTVFNQLMQRALTVHGGLGSEDGMND